MMIDRLASTYRPWGWPIGYQRWHHLLFLHWPVSADRLRPLVPIDLSLDLYEGVAYAGLVAFVVEHARPSGLPAPLGLDFLETNVRTYVHREGQEPGIYFFSLDASSLPAVVGARVAFGLPYFHARMRMRCCGPSVEYAMHRVSGERPGLTVRYELGQPLGSSLPGSLDHFLLERYLLHVQRQDGLWTMQVHHHPYPARQVRLLALHERLLAAAGISVAGGPALVHYASRVDVDIFAPQRRPR
jgi:uncharacterized protein YqjF (DUF2071 family)